MERASHLEEMRSYAAQNAQDQLDDLDALLARSDDWGLELNALELPTPVLNSGASTQSAPAYNLAGDHQARADVAHRRLAAGRETQRRFRERKKVHLYHLCSREALHLQIRCGHAGYTEMH